MKIGKLSDQYLNELVLSRLPKCSPSVIEGPGSGLDCGVINLGKKYLVVSSDPITGAGKNIGKIAVNVSANDIASCGLKASSIIIVIIMPENSDESALIEIVDDIASAAKELEIDVVGGHTEVSAVVNRPVVITTAFAVDGREHVVHSFGAKAGDSIIMTKHAAIEGTSIIAHDYEERLQGVLSEEDLTFAMNLDEKLSVVAEGVLTGRSGLATAMHDATEGGILGACREMAEASKLGCFVDTKAIKIYPQTVKICERFSLDPYRLIASGSMLITTSKPNELLGLLHKEGIEATVIGKIVEEGCSYRDLSGDIHELLPVMPDELYKID